FGLNHAYTYPLWQKRAHQVGIGWCRMWCYSWPLVEPEQGVWNFGLPDQILAYVHQTGMRFLALLPYSSCNWSTTAPADARPYMPPDYPTDRVSAKPESMTHWKWYVEETARHLRDRVSVFEILNEPLWGNDALHPKGGHNMGDYREMLRTAFQTFQRAAPEAKIIGGLSGEPSEHAALHTQFLATDTVHSFDLFSIHDHPPDAGARAEEPAFECLSKDLLERAGENTPIWLTAFGYYADDDPDILPEETTDRSTALQTVKNEQRAADLTVQYSIIAAAYGVDKIFYDTDGGLSAIPNCDAGREILFEWDGAPRKVFAAQAALADRLRPETDFRERLELGPGGGLPVYVFDSPEGSTAFVWADDGQCATFQKPPIPNIVFRNIVGNPINDATITIDQSPTAILSETDAAVLSAWLIDTVSSTIRLQIIEY
ncbi:MAG: hypothetical protein ABIH23_27755, partial [bacterium]